MSGALLDTGTLTKHAEALGDLLVEADYRGHYSHGMNRLEMYVGYVKSGACDDCACVDGRNGLGAVVGNFCINVAIEKAKSVGVGFVSAKSSNHYGIAGMYSLQALKCGLLGFTCTNASPFANPTRSKQAALGTNPIALGAPAKNGDSFLLDMSTTVVAVGKIEMQRRKNQPILEGWAQNKDGMTTNAQEAFDAACLMPLGGYEINSRYKGFGLGMLVEILCGILAGSDYGPNIRRFGDTSRTANLGHCFIAIDPANFAPCFEERMSDLMRSIRCMEPVECDKPVLVAGDPERLHMETVDKSGGVRYVKNQMKTCLRLSKNLKVQPLKPLC